MTSIQLVGPFKKHLLFGDDQNLNKNSIVNHNMHIISISSKIGLSFKSDSWLLVINEVLFFVIVTFLAACILNSGIVLIKSVVVDRKTKNIEIIEMTFEIYFIINFNKKCQIFL